MSEFECALRVMGGLLVCAIVMFAVPVLLADRSLAVGHRDLVVYGALLVTCLAVLLIASGVMGYGDEDE